MLEAMWSESDRPRSRLCRRVVSGQGFGVDVDRSLETGTAFARGLQSCGHVTCPRCGPIIRRAERDRLEHAVQGHLDAGGTLLTGVFTLSHGPFDHLSDLVAGLEAGRRKAFAGTWYRDRERFGVVGSTWHLETMWGSPQEGLNGWHPHYHTLLFVDRELTDGELDELNARLYGRYSAGLKSVGYRSLATFNHLQRVNTASKAAHYVAKDMAEEMVMGETKTGTGVSPLALLHRFTETGDMEDLDRFNQHEMAMASNGNGKGRPRRWRQWSKGLADRYGVEDATEAADQAAADAEDADGDSGSEHVLHVETPVWNEMTAQLGAVETLYSLVEECRDNDARAYVDTFRQRLIQRGDLPPDHRGETPEERRQRVENQVEGRRANAQWEASQLVRNVGKR